MAAYRGMAKNMFDGGNVTFEDPTVAVDLYAYRPPWMEEIKKVDRHTDRAGGVSFQEGRGTKKFFQPGSSLEGKMAAEQYYNHTRPHQGSLATMRANKSINTRYADVIRTHLNKYG
ncbi:uncharacterized protein [Physcomitrium patens]|uniref:Uncharacterized protein n=1 Tax=Physcomitrium patens TaxID=3218 RepID=A0A2K1IBN9_PHYPA|nr:uncharacterized protein LOC112278052 isoform X2 [Physcomitrium patens]PNR26677.1 hypothetical protein PHYPA_030158 [Physcomitrium patens]|eukprot:XP_024366831.1 uncharacterized protein LOC112278052 isoform X2 [Physcomitrella patens]